MRCACSLLALADMADDGPKRQLEYRSVRIGLSIGAALTLGFLLVTRSTVDPVDVLLLLVFIAGMLSVDIPGLRGL
jgi:hypothetical protein